MARLSYLLQERMSQEQRELLAAITGGKRGAGRPLADFLTPEGGMRGPFNALLHCPSIGAIVQRLGETLRFEGALPGDCREIAILVVAAHWRARYEWWAHARIAKGEGVAGAAIDAIAAGEVPPLEDTSCAAVYQFARELVRERDVSDATYAGAEAALGEEGVVELVLLIGYYSLISMILNAFQVPLPVGAATPFDPPERGAGR